MNKYYTSEPVNIHIKSLIDITQENNRVITTKKGKGKLPLYRGNRIWLIPISVLGCIRNRYLIVFAFKAAVVLLKSRVI